MNVKIQSAVPDDAHSIVEIATQVKLQLHKAKTYQQRGFLIENSLEQYQYFIAHDDVLVVKDTLSNHTIGFSIVLGFETIEKYGIQQKAEKINWKKSFINNFKQRKFAFYEQIAFLPRYSKSLYVLYLGFISLWRTFKQYDDLFGAVVRYPIQNKAPMQFIEYMEWRKVGSINENYPEYGQIGYDIYYLDRRSFEEKLKKPIYIKFVKRLREYNYLA
jgi:hypothetical protein